jgi:hypothetical protein
MLWCVIPMDYEDTIFMHWRYFSGNSLVSMWKWCSMCVLRFICLTAKQFCISMT